MSTKLKLLVTVVGVALAISGCTKKDTTLVDNTSNTTNIVDGDKVPEDYIVNSINFDEIASAFILAFIDGTFAEGPRLLEFDAPALKNPDTGKYEAQCDEGNATTFTTMSTATGTINEYTFDSCKTGDLTFTGKVTLKDVLNDVGARIETRATFSEIDASTPFIVTNDTNGRSMTITGLLAKSWEDHDGIDEVIVTVAGELTLSSVDDGIVAKVSNFEMINDMNVLANRSSISGVVHFAPMLSPLVIDDSIANTIKLTATDGSLVRIDIATDDSAVASLRNSDDVISNIGIGSIGIQVCKPLITNTGDCVIELDELRGTEDKLNDIEAAEATLLIAQSDLADANDDLVVAADVKVATQADLTAATTAFNTAQSNVLINRGNRDDAQAALTIATADVAAKTSAEATAQSDADTAQATHDAAVIALAADPANATLIQGEIDAQTALTAAQGVLATAQTALSAAIVVEADAQAELTTAQTALTDSQAILATAQTTLTDAQTALTAATADVVAKQAVVDAAVTAEADAQSDLDALQL